MGKRKRLAAQAIKDSRKTQYFAKLNGVPSSPRKMRYVVDMIRGMEVNRALGTLRFSAKLHRCLLRNFCVRLSATGRLKMTARLTKANSSLRRCLLTKVSLLSVCVLLHRDVAIVFANVPIT